MGAAAEFGLETAALRWDLTSVVVSGEYPAEEQAVAYPRLQYGYGGEGQKQVRYLQVTTTDGAVPVWDQVHDGATADVATVIGTMRALRQHAGCTDSVLLGDSKLLSAANRQALLAAGIGYLAPLARTQELDAEFLAIPPGELVPLEYVSAREQRLPPEERTTYQGVERTAAVAVSDGQGSERERAEAEIAKVVRQVGSRWCPTVERAQAKIEAILERRHLVGLYEVTCTEQDEQTKVSCEVNPAALARAEALDGYYVLETTRRWEEADSLAVLTEWKGQWQIEHRHRNAKGPLRIRPLFVTSNQRIVGLITILGIALLVFSLIERAARQALAVGEKVPNLLAGHVAARPTGENILNALQDIALVKLDLAGVRHRVATQLSPLHQTLLHLVGVPETAYAVMRL